MQHLNINLKKQHNQITHLTQNALLIFREFKQIATAGATTAAVTEKVWGEYVSVVCQILAKRNTKIAETWTKEFKIYFIWFLTVKWLCSKNSGL